MKRAPAGVCAYAMRSSSPLISSSWNKTICPTGAYRSGPSGGADPPGGAGARAGTDGIRWLIRASARPPANRRGPSRGPAGLAAATSGRCRAATASSASAKMASAVRRSSAPTAVRAHAARVSATGAVTNGASADRAGGPADDRASAGSRSSASASSRR